jgi:hypothetical protein
VNGLNVLDISIYGSSGVQAYFRKIKNFLNRKLRTEKMMITAAFEM